MTEDTRLPTVEVLGSSMAYRSAGESGGPVALFLHGNPTSSYIWRDIIPGVASTAHCIAPDLIGFGQSGKPPISYRFADQARYLDAFIDAMEIEQAYLVAQDWGTALAFDLAARRPNLVTGLAFMEFIRPMERWADFHQSEAARDTFRKFRTPGIGEELILDGNVFVERILPGSIVRPLAPEEMATYRAPFPTRESRVPMWRLPNELPIERQPADVWDRLTRAHQALAASTYRKMLFAGDPGALVSPAFGAAFAAGLTNCDFVLLGEGRHYLQEDHPKAIADRVAHEIRAIATNAKSLADIDA
ncbi:Haloalkane dehalogenase OS=Bosea thiooxidans OX=53254 GN=dhaA PE=3 SV=1 [Bosea thiooxidans]|uniref:Haloalkane dehalogenase n=1 Tax=Bosea thiooxidans TaxID=53254 RepID=A0A1T5FNG1_9HYPH|nr:haloalkane dehalogenase [Bosea thiooxidans]SKB97668.1 haloalkane dehalogenase [Bosea thiooxidans]